MNGYAGALKQDPPIASIQVKKLIIETKLINIQACQFCMLRDVLVHMSIKIVLFPYLWAAVVQISRFDISDVERGQRSSFWDHSELFWFTGFGVIDPNRPIY